MAAATTSPPACSATTTMAMGWFSATASCRRARSRKHASRRPTSRNRLSASLRGPDMAVDDRFSQDYPEPDGDQPLGMRSEIVTGPVSDWAAASSHLEPQWSADPSPIQDDLRQRCPIAHTERFGGGWLPTRYEDVAAIAYDTGHFSSRSIIMSNFRPPIELAPIGGSPPISSPPPLPPHTPHHLLPPDSTSAG